MRFKIIGLLLSLIFVGCAHSIHTYSASDYSPMVSANSQKISVESQQFVVFWFSMDTNYVERAYEDLQSKCPGEISGINTRYSTSLGFFSWTNKIHVEAYCL